MQRRGRGRWLAASVVAVLVAAAACTEPAAPPISPAAVELGGRWTDVTTGTEVPNGDPPGSALVVAVVASSNRCGQQDGTAILRVSWPLGTETGPPYDVPSFLRDTEGAELDTVDDAQSELDVAPPPDAPPVRFTQGASSLRITADAGAAYVGRADGRLERWARLTSGTGQCA